MASISRARFGASLATTVAALSAGRVAFADDVPFDPSAYRHYRIAGRGTIAGTIQVALSNNTTATKGGASVIALPDTQLTRSWLQSSAHDITARPVGPSQFDDPPVPEALVPFVHETRAGSDGAFAFRHLASGTYFLRGKLSIGFPRDVYFPVPSTAVGPQGQPIYGESSSHAQVFDYSYVWLDSSPVTVSGSQSADVTFHIVARLDKFDPHH